MGENFGVGGEDELVDFCGRLFEGDGPEVGDFGDCGCALGVEGVGEEVLPGEDLGVNVVEGVFD